jgi:hypothetical protein
LRRTIAAVSQALALARHAAARTAGHVRPALVVACAAALILAGSPLPF